MDNIIIALVAAALVVALVWLVLTWWFADNEPAFGPPSENRVTFKRVLQGVLRDLVDICAPLLCFGRRVWAFVGPRLTNLPAMAVIALDIYAAMTPELREVFMQNKWAALLLLALNIVARLSPRDAPSRIPPPPALGMGPGAAVAHAAG